MCGEYIQNVTDRTNRLWQFTIGVTYDIPREKVETLCADLKELLSADAQISSDAMTVTLNEFSASSMDILVRCYVTAVDYTASMLREARRNAGALAGRIRFRQMNAEELRFRPASFDVLVTRNVTWNLHDPEKAYAQWMRVLKPGGVLLNFDANYGNDDCSDTSGLPKNHAHYTVGDELLQECEEIKKQLPISSYARPAWDLNVLGKAGFSKFGIDLEISSRIYIEKDEFYNPTPLFMLRTVK